MAASVSSVQSGQMTETDRKAVHVVYMILRNTIEYE